MRDTLRRVPLFSQLTDLELDALQVLLRPLHLSSQEVVFRQGTPGDSMIFVIDGLLSVEVDHGWSGRKHVNQVGEGEVVGEISCIDPGPRLATVHAERDTLAYELTREGLLELRMGAPWAAATVVGAVVRDVTRRLREADQQIGDELQRHAGGPPSPAGQVAPPAAQQHPGGHRSVRAPVVPLHGLPSLSSFCDEELMVLRTMAVALSFSDGEMLCQEGAPGDCCYFILFGEVDVERGLDDGEVVLAVLPGESLVGQIALIDAGPRSASVRARGNVAALALTRDAYERLLQERSPLGLRIQDQIATAGIRQLRGALEWLARLTTGPAEHERRQQALTYVQAAIREWGFSIDELQRLHQAKTP